MLSVLPPASHQWGLGDKVGDWTQWKQRTSSSSAQSPSPFPSPLPLVLLLLLGWQSSS